MLVNVMSHQEKKHRLYHYLELFDRVKERSAEEFAIALKGKPENLGCETAFDLLFKVDSRFNSIKSFRECLMQRQEDIEWIYSSPIMFLEPARIISHMKFKYALEQCPSNPRRKQIYKAKLKEKHNLTTGSGKPIFSSYNVYRHYLTTKQWNRFAQIPLVMLFFERSLHAH
jgi:hypothetical protein